MATTGIGTLDHAPQVFAEWLNELCNDLGCEKPLANTLLRETLHAIRDYLTPDEAADLAAQLPVLVRGVYYDGWVPSKTPVKPRNKADLLARIDARFQKDPLDHQITPGSSRPVVLETQQDGIIHTIIRFASQLLTAAI